jgi:hypothetical protein
MPKKPIKKLDDPKEDQRKGIQNAITKAIATKKIKAVKVKFK